MIWSSRKMLIKCYEKRSCRYLKALIFNTPKLTFFIWSIELFTWGLVKKKRTASDLAFWPHPSNYHLLSDSDRTLDKIYRCNSQKFCKAAPQNHDRFCCGILWRDASNNQEYRLHSRFLSQRSSLIYPSTIDPKLVNGWCHQGRWATGLHSNCLDSHV